jgi:hypothetical protein
MKKNEKVQKKFGSFKKSRNCEMTYSETGEHIDLPKVTKAGFFNTLRVMSCYPRTRALMRLLSVSGESQRERATCFIFAPKHIKKTPMTGKKQNVESTNNSSAENTSTGTKSETVFESRPAAWKISKEQELETVFFSIFKRGGKFTYYLGTRAKEVFVSHRNKLEELVNDIIKTLFCKTQITH